ncbi:MULTISPECIES: hypothetical protein [Bacillales]|jgi:hypothetical protein|uniref:Polyprotein protein n=1 Tax=Brevibacillus aydinogluensis TaxID=927786 RepID=A0AA48RCG8_9BACL|nr:MULTISPECIES: hypothetical protein [Bacillales]REK62244.1 MAG: hypothetical protein DF221_13150 [Brevibacillus sp.]MBR8658572.1 hypothetical protein [Brevibacillus sp. NL20B1]MDT3415358.1 hypothetical protein [Brevibacillus aydinogluensis]NNV02164.1 hypothetical protein [Brevibacillus sp. MCWH]UFJ60445.1 hypothetical protein IRT44_14305 [Anoxybacillus sediminis]
MTTRKWRNPYAPIPSRKLSDKVQEVSLAVTPRKTVPEVTDLRSSVSRMRSNIKGISSTIRQVEETMDTLYGAMQLFERLGKRSAEAADTEKPAGKRQSAETSSPANEAAEGNNGGGNLLGNIDINQLLSLLQSPLVQSLLNQTANGAAKRKKEG